MRDFQAQVLHYLRQIPFGKVVSYGQLAALAGKPRAARQVGAILRTLPVESDLPWHRVLNYQGKISLSWESGALQRARLESEGLFFDSDGCCDLAAYRWQAFYRSV